MKKKPKSTLKVKTKLKAGHKGTILIEDQTPPTSGDFPGADLDAVGID